MDAVKHGRVAEPVPARLEGDAVRWEAGGVTSTVRAPGAGLSVHDGGATVTWTGTIAARGVLDLSWGLEVLDTGGVVGPAPRSAAASPVVRADDRRLARWVEASLADLDALRMVRTEHPDDAFAAAGAPWYLTLFGRDSIWAARMALPLGTDLAAGTLRTLAGLQGTEHDVPTQQQPGKILHELRRAATVLESGAHLPPVYYGTVDATPLFVCLLHDAWRWGMPEDEVRALLPAARAALDWVVRWGDADGDGLLEYVDTEGTGLANQGWKDSGDSVRFADGRQATAPIALAEVQGYAHEALQHGADLLAALGDDDVAGYREVAARLRQRFADAFWVDGDDGRYPALALDADKTRVDAVASNMGHLPGTGLLGPDDEALVADVLTRADNDSGFGLRTMSSRSGGYAPLSYHCGSVWPHDTAITLLALSRAGLGARGAGLLSRPGRGRRGVRLPPARAVVGRRPRRGRPARPVPRRVPPAGVVGDVGGGRRAGAPGARGRRARGRRDVAAAAPEPGRRAAGRGPGRGRPSRARSRSTPTARWWWPRAPACGGTSSADVRVRYVPRCTACLLTRTRRRCFVSTREGKGAGVTVIASTREP